MDHGLKVVGLARRLDRLKELEEKFSGKKGSFHGMKTDISNTDEIVSTFKTIEENYGPIHILVNNAGIVQKTTIMDGDVEKWKKVFDVNVIGLCCATKEAIASMRRHNVDGHIVHMNSVAGHRIPPSTITNVYPASKHAVTALTESLRHEFSEVGSRIKITSISPGLTETEIFEVSGLATSFPDDLPILKTEDIADATIYALSTPPHVQVHEVTLKPVGAGP